MLPIRVVIAEPDPPLLKNYCEFLTKEGFQVAATGNGPDCVRLLRRICPHVLILEPDLDEGWGDRLLEWMRNDRQASHIPVIVATRKDDVLHEYPVRACFVKPFPMRRLLASAKNLVVAHLCQRTEDESRSHIHLL